MWGEISKAFLFNIVIQYWIFDTLIIWYTVVESLINLLALYLKAIITSYYA